jgi:glycosyltransferase involved in cell wall biosynthesis
LQDEELSRRFGEQGRARVEREFRWEQVGQKVLDVLSAARVEGPRHLTFDG